MNTYLINSNLKQSFTSFLLDIYAPVLGHSPKVDDLITKLKHKITQELNYQKKVLEMMGSLDTLFAASAMATYTAS